jgi:hypothetical protein
MLTALEQNTHSPLNAESAARNRLSTRTAAERQPPLGQITLVLQGGGALGAYQAGVYQAMHEAGIEPDWIIGTSIGAINASLIAGNPPDRRLEALTAFWKKVQRSVNGADWARAFSWFTQPPGWAENCSTFFSGIPGFFEPNYMNFFRGLHAKVHVSQAGLALHGKAYLTGSFIITEAFACKYSFSHRQVLILFCVTSRLGVLKGTLNK